MGICGYLFLSYGVMVALHTSVPFYAVQ